MSLQATADAACGHPILQAQDHAATFVHMPDGPITVGQFRGAVAALAERLPEARYVVNLCTDRYRFAVAFAD